MPQRSRFAFLRYSAALGVAVLSGCTTHVGAPEGTAEWEEPGWMAQVRQEDEAHQEAMVDCYAEHGLEGIRTIGGGVVLVFESEHDPEPEVPPRVRQLMDAAADDCNARVPLPEHRASATFDDTSYKRTLDVRECLVVQGHRVPEAPSAQKWRDSTYESAWNPYSAMFENYSGDPISQDALKALMEACPQSGPTFYAEIPE